MSDLQPWRNPRTSPYQAGAAKAYLEPFSRARLRAWWPALLWAAVIFTMSTDAFSAQHTASFLGPILRWFYPSMTHLQFHLIHYYILEQIPQAFAASRQASSYDSLLDSMGAFVAFTVLWLWFRLRTKNLST